MPSERIGWIDNLKAIGIFLVVLSHHKMDENIILYIFSFHVPLFFLVSGYLYNAEKYDEFGTFIKSKIKTLIVPYFFFSSASFLFWLLIVRELNIDTEALRISPMKSFIGIFYGIGVDKWNAPLNPAVWFLTCLFMVEVLFRFIDKSSERAPIKFLILAGCAAVGFATSLAMPFRLPWNADVAMTAMAFYAIGYYFREFIDRMSGFIVSKNLFLLIPVAMISIMFSFLNGRIDMNGNSYGNMVYFYVAALAGTMMVIVLSKIIPPNPILSFLGRNTIIVLGLSGTSLFIIKSVYFMAFGHVPKPDTVPLVQGTVLSVLQLVVLSPIIYVINTCFPFLLGRQRKPISNRV